MKTQRGFTVLIVLLLTGLTGLPCWAGFGGQIPVGGGRGQGRGVNLNTDIPAADVARLTNAVPPRGTNPFAGKTPAQVQQKVKDLRRTILRLIPILRCENPRIAACIQKALETNRICIDTARPHAAATIQIDGRPTCGNEPINIGILNVPCTTDLCNVQVFTLASLLLHEGLHGIQDWRDTTRARRMKKYHQNEADASGLQVRTACELIDALTALRNTGVVPANTPPFARKFANAWRGKTNAQIAAAVAALQPLKEFWNATKSCRLYYVTVYCLFIDGIIDRDKVNDYIRKSKWYKDYGNVAGLGPFSLAYLVRTQQSLDLGTGDLTVTLPRELEQIPANGSPVNITLPNYPAFYGARVSPDGSQMYFMFSDEDIVFPQGYLYCMEDTNGDGFFEPGTLQLLITDPAFAGGFDLAFHPQTWELYGYNPATTNLDLFAFFDTNFDFLPDQFAPAGGFQPADPDLREDLISLRFSEDGNTLFAQAEESPDYDTGTPHDWAYATAILNGPNYDPGPDFHVLSESPFPPAFLRSPRSDQPDLFVNGPPGHQVQVLDVSNPGAPFPVGNGMLDQDGFAVINLGPPPPPGAEFQLVDLNSGLEGAVELVQNDSPTGMDLRRVPAADLSGFEGAVFRIDWPLGDELETAHVIGDWQTLEEYTAPYYWYGAPPEAEPEVNDFFRSFHIE